MNLSSQAYQVCREKWCEVGVQRSSGGKWVMADIRTIGGAMEMVEKSEKQE